MNSYDVVIVGAGPAGLSAALVLGRARRSVLVVDAGTPRNRCSPSVHGFLTRDGTAPREFLAAARAEVEAYGVALREERATAVRRTTEGFTVELGAGGPVRARRVVAAGGLTDRLPDIDGAVERWGRDVLHCPYCHGWEVRDRPLAVVAGDRDGAVHQALLLRQWSPEVTLLLHDVPEADLDPEEVSLLHARGVTLLPGRVAAVRAEDDRLIGVRLADGRGVDCAAVFVALTFEVNAAPFAPLDLAQDHSDMGSCVRTDAEGRTSHPGVWAAGNVADLSAQVLDAAAAGARAAIGINGELVLEDAHRAQAGGLRSGSAVR